jgi:hypothetical protein
VLVVAHRESLSHPPVAVPQRSMGGPPRKPLDSCWRSVTPLRVSYPRVGGLGSR